MSAPPDPIHVRIRANICRACADPCPERDTLDLAAGCTACPRRIWHAIDCQPDSPPAPMRGLGDLVAKFAEPIASAMHLDKSKCNCGKRQAWLNEKVPFGKPLA